VFGRPEERKRGMRWVKAAFVPVLAVVSACVAIIGLELADHLLDYRFMALGGERPWVTSVYALILLSVPVATGLFVVRALRGWWPWSLSNRRGASWKRAAYGGVAVVYVLTAWVGAPMVQSDLTDMVIGEYRAEQHIDDSGVLPYHRVLKQNPWCRTFLNVPIVPGVVVVYHEYQASGLNGRGAFYIFLWYGTGARYVGSFQRWVS
jgi:hypothetical protein